MHKFTINGRPDFRKRLWYMEGEPIFFEIVTPTDTSVYVTCDDVDLIGPEYESYSMAYKFIMPDHDVNVTVNMVNTMMYDPNRNIEMGFMGKEINLKEMNGKIPVSDIKNKFCPECGAILDEDGKCPYCKYVRS